METKSVIQGWIWDAQEKYRRYRQIIEDCDRIIARLEPVYQTLGEIKDDFRNVRRGMEELFEDEGNWHGKTYTSFYKAGTELSGTCGEYFNRLDAAQDAVNERIGELKAKKKELIPIIGSLLSQIEQWRVSIENALN